MSRGALRAKERESAGIIRNAGVVHRVGHMTLVVGTVEVDAIPAPGEIDVGADTSITRLLRKAERIIRTIRGCSLAQLTSVKAPERRSPSCWLVWIEVVGTAPVGIPH